MQNWARQKRTMYKNEKIIKELHFFFLPTMTLYKNKNASDLYKKKYQKFSTVYSLVLRYQFGR